jgi:thymidine kinase
MSDAVRKGKVVKVVGPMFCGKSTELIRRVNRQRFGNKKVQVFRPQTDARSPSNTVQSRDSGTVEAIEIVALDDLLDVLEDDTDVVAIDEVQFLPDIVEICNVLTANGYDMIISGLDFTYQGTPFRIEGFGCILDVVAEQTITLTAVCMEENCSNDAPFTERIVRGKTIKMTGDKEMYRAVCRDHFGTFSA